MAKLGEVQSKPPEACHGQKVTRSWHRGKVLPCPSLVCQVHFPYLSNYSTTDTIESLSYIIAHSQEFQQTSCINIAIKQWHAPDACLQINMWYWARSWGENLWPARDRYSQWTLQNTQWADQCGSTGTEWKRNNKYSDWAKIKVISFYSESQKISLNAEVQSMWIIEFLPL